MTNDDDAAPTDLRHEREYRVAVGRDERPRHVAGEVKRVELLIRVANAARIVHEHRPVARALEKERCVEVRRIEGRILANEHRVDRGEPRNARMAH